MTLSESPGISKAHKAAPLNFQHHALWAPSQRWWFSTHHLLVAWTWPWGFRLVQYHSYSFHQSSTLEKIWCLSIQVACAWTMCHLQHAPAEPAAQPTTGHWVSCIASARRGDHLQTQWDTYLDVLSNPFCQQHLILGKTPVNRRGRHEEQLSFLLQEKPHHLPQLLKSRHLQPGEDCWSLGLPFLVLFLLIKIWLAKIP